MGKTLPSEKKGFDSLLFSILEHFQGFHEYNDLYIVFWYEIKPSSLDMYYI